MLPHLKKNLRKIERPPDIGNFVAGVGPGFNPLTYDPGNLDALYDGDVGLTIAGWNDQAGGGHNIVFFNNPTIVPNAQNGHQSVLFNGTNQWGTVATPNRAAPFTSYYVFRFVTHVGNRYMKDDGVVLTTADRVQLQLPANNMIYNNDARGIITVPNFVLNQFNILTCKVELGANNMIIRTNNNAAVTNTILAPNNRQGITLASGLGGVAYGNCEWLYAVHRGGADSTTVQDQFINYFKSRFIV